ncbi:MAG TPA: dephospho-CoA kinase [Candidatus Choladousia intestinavium]|uniref:Dephospho-CoA kinase n=1 Tax=Candidatus Choladousia intestinavium TaxID=2840727 RepID=A0A9D1ADZ0_9FIRM|nr:dephospho-CoA kinase [Candidatus Choladousia intestinavium]
MKVLGITGGIGAGKSTVLSYLEEKYHARVIQADLTARQLQQPGGVCFRNIVEEFGREILNREGNLDREKLSKTVFSDLGKLKRLNELVHPYVKEEIKRQIRKEKERGEVPFIAVEAALLLEDHYETVCDEIWYIYADVRTREERLKESRGYTEEKIRRVMENQLEETEYRKKCDFVIDNSSKFVENTYEQIDKGLVEHGFL